MCRVDFLPSTPLLRGKFWLKKRGILRGRVSNYLKMLELFTGGKRRK
jgi:hypothetical protein